MSLYNPYDPSLEADFPNTVNQRIRKFSLRNAYKVNPWVYTCVNAVASAISGVPLLFYTEDNSGGEVLLPPKHPVRQLFGPPKKWLIPTLSQLIKFIFMHLNLFGEVFIVLERNTRGRPINVSLRSPFVMFPIINSETEQIDGWAEKDPKFGSVKRTYLDRDLIQIKYPNPYNEHRGMAPLTAARLSVEQDLNMSAWNAGFFQGGVRNPIAITSKRRLNATQARELRNRITKDFRGFKDGQGPLVLDNDSDVKTLVQTMKDLDFIQGKQLTREEICAIYSVPPAVVGIYRYANYANSEAQQKLFWETNCLPKMQELIENLQTLILEPNFPGVMCRWDKSVISAINQAPGEKAEIEYKKAQTVSMYLSAGYSKDDVAGLLEDERLGGSSSSDDNEGRGLEPSRVRVSLESGREKVRVTEHNGVKRIEIDPDALQRYGVDYSEKVLKYYTGRMLRILRTFFDALHDRYMVQVRRGLVPEVDANQWAENFREAAQPLIKTIGYAGAERLAREVEEPQKTFSFMAEISRGKAAEDFYSREELQYIDAVVEQFTANTAGLTARMVQDINAAMRVAITQANLSVSDISKIVGEVVTETYEGRSLTIARTVAGGAHNSARFVASQVKGGKRHRWLSAGDGEVRDHHVREHGNEVDIGSRFPVTNLRYPLDPTGSAAEIINCRCTAFVTELRSSAEAQGGPRGVPAIPGADPVSAGGGDFADIKAGKAKFRDTHGIDVRTPGGKGNDEALTELLRNIDQDMERLKAEYPGIAQLLALRSAKDVEVEGKAANVYSPRLVLRWAMRSSNPYSRAKQPNAIATAAGTGVDIAVLQNSGTPRPVTSEVAPSIRAGTQVWSVVTPEVDAVGMLSLFLYGIAGRMWFEFEVNELYAEAYERWSTLFKAQGAEWFRERISLYASMNERDAFLESMIAYLYPGHTSEYLLPVPVRRFFDRYAKGRIQA